MPLKGALVGWLGSSSTVDTIDKIYGLGRHPEGGFIPFGRGLWDLASARRQNRKVRVLPHPNTDRRDIIPASVGSGVTKGGGAVASIPRIPAVVKPQPGRPGPVLPAVARPSAVSIQKETKVGLDLGNLIGKGIDVWGGVQMARAGRPAAAQTVSAPVTQWGGTGYGTGMLAGPTLIADDSGPGFGVPGYEVISESELDKGMVYKKVCGVYKWVKQKRRRRRKLLTDADFNALLRLQALKVNQNMTVAIAKALGR